MTNLEEFETYEEYRKNFRKTHHPREHAMSRDQFERIKKNAEKQKKMAANEGNPDALDTSEQVEEAGTIDWLEQEGGPAEKIIEKYGNTTSADIAERRLTREQQGILANGNQGDDHINHPDALDTSDITKLGKKELASVQTKDNMNPATYSISNEDRTQMMKDVGISPEKIENIEKIENEVNTTISESVSAAVTPKEDDPPGVVYDKNKYSKAMMSIWDAYRAGEIDKETAGYFTIDAIATLAKNLGRSIGNVGAQFSGGTIDNGHDESKWGQRQNALLNEEIGKETESLGGAAGRQAENETLDNEAKKIKNTYAPAQIEQQIESENLDIEAKKIRNTYTPAQIEQQIEMFKKELEMADINLDMAHSRTDIINFIKKDPNYSKSSIKMFFASYLTQAGAAGAVDDASKILGDAINLLLPHTRK